MDNLGSSLVPLAAAVIGGLITGGFSFFALKQQHANDLVKQKEQWKHERESVQAQREADKQEQREAIQRETMRELEVSMPSFSGAARAMFGWGQTVYHAEVSGDGIPDPPASLASEVEQFNKLRYSVMGCVTRISNEKLRRRASHLFQLNEAMALGLPALWERPRETFGGIDPIVLQVHWQEQMLSMTGRLYRGDSIENAYVEEHMHNADPRK